MTRFTSASGLSILFTATITGTFAALACCIASIVCGITPSSAATTTVVNGQEGYKDFPLSQMRKVIAQRLSESKFTAPHFYLRMTVTMDKAIEARNAVNEVAPVKISFNDFIIKFIVFF